MDIVKEVKLVEFLNLKSAELLNYYESASNDVKKAMEYVYNACYRFNLNNNHDN